MKDCLEIEAVEAGYGLSRVLHGVSLSARAGEVVSLLGRNGAGKSTTLKAIVGLVEVTEGVIRGVNTEVQRKRAPSTYTAAGLRATPNPRHAAPLAISRTL